MCFALVSKWVIVYSYRFGVMGNVFIVLPQPVGHIRSISHVVLISGLRI